MSEAPAPLAPPVPPTQEVVDSQAYWQAIMSVDFQNRCQLAWLTASVEVTTEDPTAIAAHTSRLRYSAKVFQGIVSPMQLASYVMTNTTVQADVAADYAAGAPIGNSVSDNDIMFQVTSLYTGIAMADMQLSQTP